MRISIRQSHLIGQREDMTPIQTIALSGSIAGLLDITATGVLRRIQGVPFRRLLQFVASGVMGASAFEGDLGASSFGLLLHFGIALVWAAAYFFLSLHTPALLKHPLLYGSLYGIFVHLCMSLIVVPLSRTTRRPFTWAAWTIQLVIHVACVGIPIALVESISSR